MYKVLLLLPLAGCLGGDVSVTPVKTDDDNDGYNIEVDCDDAHATVNPDAEEVCDGLDNDCNQAVDDAPADGSSFFADTDGDGFGDPATATIACAAAAGYVADNTDCNDQSSSMAPGLDEICDGLDNDCNGAVDDSPIDELTIYVDTDGDGYGDDGTATVGCELGSGEVDQGGDCDDGDSAIHPGASETDCTDPTDYNCDGSSAYADADGDGSPACSDCNDQDAAVHPGASEVCNDLDDDCDGWTDDDDDSLTGASTWYRDPDGDGYASGTGSTLTQCDLPSGYAAATGDCDDYDATVSPAAMEVCDGADVDEDCDGLSDDSDPNVHSGSWSTWYRDADGDGYGDSARSVLQCDAPSSYISQGGDCDDAAAAVNPGASEVCNTLDDDCDLLTDDQDPGVSGLSTWYTDGDGDGYGDTASRACTRPSGSVATGGDCDDNDSSVSPGATELCDSTNTDEDCNGLADDDDGVASGKSSWYRDNDGDGYGGSTSILACDASSGYIRSGGDCDDSNASISPGAVEVCDSADVDEDCDGVADDGDSGASGKTTIYEDSDGDGYGGGSGIVRCNLLSGYVSNALDCNDANNVINPGAVEICDSSNADEDCDGLAD
ncbi:MAG TPA: putative metal-binding motif-containing protein, partial [Myxococcota bacterium]|nr:putative metal-binding motif-containing protein [Myxococcota bacterium]